MKTNTEKKKLSIVAKMMISVAAGFVLGLVCLIFIKPRTL